MSQHDEEAAKLAENSVTAAHGTGTAAHPHGDEDIHAHGVDANKIREALVLHNIMEDSVVEKTKTIVARMDMCKCEKCYLDVCALVLNQLPPKYVTTFKGSLMSRLPAMTQKSDLDLTVLITRCAKMVQKKPMH